jgi:hypothetical protein
MGATVHYADDRIGLASSSNIYISVLRKPLDADGVRRLHLQAKEMFQRFGKKVGSLSVIEAGSHGAPTPEVREAVAKLAREFPILGAGIVLEGSGFGAAAIRTLIAGIYLVTKKDYPHKVFESPRPAVDWLTPILAQGGVTVLPSAILAAVEETRRAIR